MIKIYSPSKGEKEMADWIENWLRERNIPFQSDHAGEAYGGNGRNIVAFVKGNTKERPLGFAAHMDQIEPCRNVNPVINGNIISTDKTTTLGGDDKAGISAIMEAVEDIIESGVPHRDIYLVFTCSEEISMMGTKHMDMSMLPCKELVVVDATGGAETKERKRMPELNRKKESMQLLWHQRQSVRCTSDVLIMRQPLISDILKVDLQPTS